MIYHTNGVYTARDRANLYDFSYKMRSTHHLGGRAGDISIQHRLGQALILLHHFES